MVIRELITKVGFRVDNSKLSRLDNDVGALKGKLSTMTHNIDAVANKLIGIGGILTASVSLPIGLIGTSSLKAASDVEQLEISLTTMLGSAEKANNLIQDMIAFTERTPFKLEGLQQTVKQLIGMGFESSTVLDVIENLGNVSSGTGADMSRMALNLAQVKLQAKLTGRDLRDFAVQGVPLLSELSRMLNKSESDIQAMVSGGEISFDTVMKAFQNMSAEGGRFSGLMEKQSKTLGGLFSIFLDKLFRLRVEIGKMLVEQLKLKKVLESVIKVVGVLVKVFERMPRPLKLIIVGLTAFLFLLGPILIGVGLLTKAFLLLKAVSLFTGVAMGTITAQMLLWPAAILAVIAAIFLLIDDFQTFKSGGRSIIGTFLDGWKVLINDLKELWGGLKGFFYDVITGDFDEIQKKLDHFKKTNEIFMRDVFGVNVNSEAFNKSGRTPIGGGLPQSFADFKPAMVGGSSKISRAGNVSIQNKFKIMVPESTTQDQAKFLASEVSQIMGAEAENIIANSQGR